MEEEWHDIVGYEGYYQVSSMGRVKSLERWIQDRFGMKAPYRIPEKILKPVKAPNGYIAVHLAKDGKVYNGRVHRLVAEAFIPNPECLPAVNHKNEDKKDNCVENLEWCSVAYNNDYGTRQQRVQMNQKHRRAVCMLSLNGDVLRTFPTCLSAARYIAGEPTGKSQRVRVTDNNIRRACRLHRHKAYGYRWEFGNVSNHSKIEKSPL